MYLSSAAAAPLLMGLRASRVPRWVWEPWNLLDSGGLVARGWQARLGTVARVVRCW